MSLDDFLRSLPEDPSDMTELQQTRLIQYLDSGELDPYAILLMIVSSGRSSIPYKIEEYLDRKVQDNYNSLPDTSEGRDTRKTIELFQRIIGNLEDMKQEKFDATIARVLGFESEARDSFAQDLTFRVLSIVTDGNILHAPDYIRSLFVRVFVMALVIGHEAGSSRLFSQLQGS